MTRERLEQTPEQQNTPDTHELDSLLTDIRAAQQKLEQRSGADIVGLQNQLAQVKAEVVRFHENNEIAWNKNELEQLKQKVKTVQQEVEQQIIAWISWSDVKGLVVEADKGRTQEANTVTNTLQNPQSGSDLLDGVLKRFGERTG